MAELISLKRERVAHRFVMNTKLQSSELIVAAYSIDKVVDLQAIREDIVRTAEVLRDLDEQILNLSLELDEEALNCEALLASNFSEKITKALCLIDWVLGVPGNDVSIISRGSSSSEAGTGRNIVHLEMNGGKKEVFNSACVVPVTCPPPGHLQVAVVTEMYPYLRALELADERHSSDREIPGGNSHCIEDLIADDHCSQSLLITSFESEPQSAPILWDEETLGTRPEGESVDVLAGFMDTVHGHRFKGPGYEMELPWKADTEKFVDDCELSDSRLLSRRLSLSGKLRRELDGLCEHDEVMSEQSCLMLERVVDLVPAIAPACHMPHHAGVYKEKETTRVGVVGEMQRVLKGLESSNWPGSNTAAGVGELSFAEYSTGSLALNNPSQAEHKEQGHFVQLVKVKVGVEGPFLSTGLDFTGPIYVRAGDDGSSKSLSAKAYILMLTCAAARAEHLELVPDLTSASLVRGLRRFISRKGCPRLIFCDNVKTFKFKETKELWKIRVEAVVLEHDRGPRIFWRLALVRVGVKREGRGESAAVERPLQKLYPLEVSSEGKKAVRGPEPADVRSAGPGASDGETLSGRQDGGPNLTCAKRYLKGFEEDLNLATSRACNLPRKLKRAAARDSDFLRNYTRQT